MKDATKGDLTASQDLSAGALSYTTSIGRKFKLCEVIIHASVAITETITITRDSKNGANYDHVLSSRDLEDEQDLVFRPQGFCGFNEGDEVRVQVTNANLTGSVFIVIKSQEMN
jgi:hypothetical protein